jgi:hypothetical protein
MEEGFVKHGMLTEDSMSDFDNTKKASYFDADGPNVADESNKDKLKRPVKIKDGYGR